MAKKEKEIKSAYEPTEHETEQLRRVYKRYEEMKNARANFPNIGNLETAWDSYEKRWEAYRQDADKEDWQTDIYIPLTTSIIESQLAEVITKSPMPSIEPQEPDDIVTAQVMKIIWKHAWRRSYSDIEHYKLLKNTLMYGTGIWQESFLDLPRTVKDLVKFDPIKGIEEYEERVMKEYYDVYGEAVDIFDLFPDDKARYFEPGPYSARDCIRRYIMHIDDYKEYFQGKSWDHLGNAQYVTPGGDTEQSMFFKRPQGLGAEEVEVLWYWSRYPDDALIIVANGVLQVDKPNPYKHKQLPFSRSVDYMRTNQFYGKGDPELLESIQDEINQLRRMRLDRTHLSFDQMYVVSNRETLDEEQLIKRPHGMIGVDDVNSIKPLEEQPMSQNAYLEEDRMKEDATRVSGIDDRFQSVNTGGTATESAILRESTLKRIQMKMIIHSKSFLPRVAAQRVANIQQYYAEPLATAIVGDKKSAEYKAKVQAARQKGMLEMRDKVAYERRYHVIPLKDKTLRLDRLRNRVYEEDTDGWTFFEATPEFIRGNVNIYFDEGSSLAISKPLEQQRLEAMLQNPLMAAAIQSGIYDLGKMTDALIRLHDYNPEEWKPDASRQEEPATMANMVDPTTEIQIAEEQNKMLMSGQEVPPTAYMTERHVKVHLAFMESEEFQQAAAQDENIAKNFVDHVMGEIKAIQYREDNGEDMGQAMPQDMSIAPSNAAQSMGGAAPEGEQFPASALQPSPKQTPIPGIIQGQADAMKAMPS